MECRRPHEGTIYQYSRTETRINSTVIHQCLLYQECLTSIHNPYINIPSRCILLSLYLSVKYLVCFILSFFYVLSPVHQLVFPTAAHYYLSSPKNVLHLQFMWILQYVFSPPGFKIFLLLVTLSVKVSRFTQSAELLTNRNKSYPVLAYVSYLPSSYLTFHTCNPALPILPAIVFHYI